MISSIKVLKSEITFIYLFVFDEISKTYDMIFGDIQTYRNTSTLVFQKRVTTKQRYNPSGPSNC